MNATDLISLTPAQFAAVIALFLPGFVSLRIDALVFPQRKSAAVSLVDILGYSLLNAGVFSWAILMAAETLRGPAPNYFFLAALALPVCILGPAIWPILLRASQRWAAKRGWVLGPDVTAWDSYFRRRESCWVVLHLANGDLVGGYFGARSVASAGEQAGSIYLEEIWQLDTKGSFLAAVPETRGGVFRSSDYLWIEFRKDD